MRSSLRRYSRTRSLYALVIAGSVSLIGPSNITAAQDTPAAVTVTLTRRPGEGCAQVPSFSDPAALVSLLRIELIGQPVRVLAARSAGPRALVLQHVRCDEPHHRIQVFVQRDDRIVHARTVDLSDVAPEIRSRTVALLLADLIDLALVEFSLSPFERPISSETPPSESERSPTLREPAERGAGLAPPDQATPSLGPRPRTRTGNAEAEQAGLSVATLFETTFVTGKRPVLGIHMGIQFPWPADRWRLGLSATYGTRGFPDVLGPVRLHQALVGVGLEARFPAGSAVIGASVEARGGLGVASPDAFDPDTRSVTGRAFLLDLLAIAHFRYRVHRRFVPRVDLGMGWAVRGMKAQANDRTVFSRTGFLVLFGAGLDWQ